MTLRGGPKRAFHKEKDMTRRKVLVSIATVVAVVAAAGCGHLMMMMHGNIPRPAETEFGTGPRPSAAGRFMATLQTDEPLRVRRLQTVRVAITDGAGQPMDDLTIAVGGGMPQHGHGLPTRPRVTRSLGEGLYEIEGVRFNMGGWWEFTLSITTPSGPDVVTFNLDL
jgi:hypothetical protein